MAIYELKVRGPRIEPCGTPEEIVTWENNRETSIIKWRIKWFNTRVWSQTVYGDDGFKLFDLPVAEFKFRRISKTSQLLCQTTIKAACSSDILTHNVPLTLSPPTWTLPHITMDFELIRAELGLLMVFLKKVVWSLPPFRCFSGFKTLPFISVIWC